MTGREHGWSSGTLDRIRGQWPELTDDDIESTQGKPAGLVALLEGKYGYARKNAQADVTDVLRSEDSVVEWDAEGAETATDRPDGAFLDLRGRRLHYIDWGNPERPPLLLLHGLGGVAREWQRIAAHFQSRYHVIALDLPGHGDSDPASEAARGPQQMVEDLRAFIERTVDGPPVIVGHGIGARLALALAESAPERVRGVVADPAEPGFEEGAPRIGPYADQGEYVQALAEQAPYTPEWGLWSIAGERLREEPGGGYVLRVDPQSFDAWRQQAAGEMQGEGMHAGGDVPLLVLEGAESGESGRAFAEELQRRRPEARMERLEGAGAHSFVDAEAAFLDAVDAFLEELR